MPIPDIVSNLSTAQFRQYVLETLESIAGTTGQVAGLSNLSTAKFRQYMLGLLVEIAQNGGGGGGAPSGPAGGDLSSTYPNPTVSKLLGRALAVATPTNGQVLAWNATSSSWTPTSVTGTGTVTSITAGAGLSGGTITGSGTIALTTTGVSALSYGSSTQVAALTIDAYGRITAASNQSITPAGIGAQAALTTAAPLALSLGGTGSTTAASALSNLGGISSAALSGYAVTSQLSAFQNSAQVQALASAQISAITPASIGAVATSSIIGISKGGTGATDAVSALSALGGITSAAISGLASTSQLSGFATTSQISGFTNTAQVSAIASAQIAAITPASIGALSTSAASGFATTTQIVGLATTAQLSAFQNSAQVQSLASAQIASITPASLGAVATSDIIGISKGGTGSTDAVSALSALGGITSAAISGLANTSQLSGFATTQQIVGIAFTSQLSGFATTDQISGFTNTAQVSAIASAQIAAITPASIGALSTSAVIAISNGGTGATDAPSALSNLGGITSAALSGYATTSQTGGLTSAQVEALTSAQIAALGNGLGAGQKYVASKTYMIGDIVSNENTSGVYVSLIDNNVNFPLYDQTAWKIADANALALQGYGLSSNVPQNGQVLKFQSGYDIWVPGEISITSAQLPSNTLEAIGGAPLSNPYFTGYGPQGPTRSFGSSDNYLATTEFVKQNSSFFKWSPVGQSKEISVGTKYFFGSGLDFVPRQAVLLYADSSNYMTGSVVSYSGGSLEIDVTNAVGSGNYDLVITVSPEVTAGSGGLTSAQVNALVTEQIAALGTGLGAGQVWNSEKSYSAGDVVTVSGTSNTYVSSTSSNIGNSPNAGYPWVLVAGNAIQLQGRNVAMATPAEGDVLTYIYSQWIPTASVAGLSSAQVEAITSAQISAITPASIGAVATSDIIAISKGGTGSTDAISALSALGAAGLESPAFTGTPTAPTAAAHTNTTQLATTEFVISNRGDSYLTTSTSPQTIGNGTKTFTVEAGLSYTPTQDVTIVYDASNHMHGLVVTYSGTTLVVDVTQHTGAGSYSLWTLNVGGLTTAAGALLSANNLSDVANTATALINIGGVSTARSVSAGTGLTGGGDLTANRTLSIAALSPDPTGTYGSTSQIPSLTVNNLGQVTAASSLAMPSTVVEVFSTPGTFTWTKPAGAKQVVVELVSGGNGGGAGGKGTSGTAIFGGTGGGAGGYSRTLISAPELEATCSVVVGTAGSGSIFGGATATQGGASSFANTSTPAQFLARAQSGGTPGQNGGTVAGTAGSGGAPNSNAGGAASATATAGAGSGSANAPTGGGAGGGVSTGGAPFNGGNGATNPFINVFSAAGGQSTVANGGNGVSAATRAINGLVMNGGGGGGGGASSFATGSGGNGANGSGYGSGGGGGGATIGAGNGGNGGNGAPGIVVVTTYF